MRRRAGVHGGMHGHAGGMHLRELVEDADGDRESGQAVQDVPRHSRTVSCMHDFNMGSHDAIGFQSVLDRLTQAGRGHVSCLPRPGLREFAMQFCAFDLVGEGVWIARRVAECVRGIRGRFPTGALPAVVAVRGRCRIRGGTRRLRRKSGAMATGEPCSACIASPASIPDLTGRHAAWPLDLVNSGISRHCLCQ
jgi:hypothetical protein